MTRCPCITQKIPAERTGLQDNLFIHVDHDDGKFKQIRFSEKKKDGNALDAILSAYGDLATYFIKNKMPLAMSVEVIFDHGGKFNSIRMTGKGFDKIATELGDVATEIIKSLGKP